MDALQDAISHLNQSIANELEACLARNVELEMKVESQNQSGKVGLIS